MSYNDACAKYSKLRSYAKSLIGACNSLPYVENCCPLRLPSFNKKKGISSLWSSLCAFDHKVGVSLGKIYDHLGEKYGSQFWVIDAVTCQPPSSFDDAAAATTDAIGYIMAKCIELKLRADNFAQIFPHRIIVTPPSKMLRYRALLGSMIVAWALFLLWTLYNLFTATIPMLYQYNPLNAGSSYHDYFMSWLQVAVILSVPAITLTVYFCQMKVIKPVCNIVATPSPSSPTSPSPSSVIVHHRTDPSNHYVIFKDWTGTTIHKMNPSTSDAEWSFSPGSDVDGFPDLDGGTGGLVVYGRNADLVTVNDKNQLILGVSRDIVDGRRRSVRIHANELYDSGVFVMDVDKVPADATTWPSFWLRGDTTQSSDVAWSCYGEVDIIEGANGNLPENDQNQCTLHTNGSACIQSTPRDGKNEPLTPADCGASGGTISYECGCDQKSLCPFIGCSYKMAKGSFGRTLNEKGGGVFACEVSVGGAVSFWFWPRNDPLYPSAQIQSGSIQTDLWQTSDPSNTIHLDACPGHFRNLAMIINTTLCGNWAGEQYRDEFNPNIKGPEACRGAVNSVDFTYPNGDWVINAVKVFQ